MVPVGQVEAVLKCTRCETTYRQIAPVVLVTEPVHPAVPWILLQAPVIQLDMRLVRMWASAHLGPVILDHYHALA